MNKEIATTFAALSDPARLAILDALTRGEADATALVDPLGLTQPTVSHHLKVLERAGLIERRRIGTRRPCRLSPDRLAEVTGWLEQLRAAMERNYTRLDNMLQQEEDTT